jgi:hypothetical protein
MAYRLEDDHHMVVHGRDLVHLDIRSGAYNLIAGGGDVATVRGRTIDVEDDALLEMLVRTEIVTDRPLTQPAPPLPALPVRSALTSSGPATYARDRLAITLAWAQVGPIFSRQAFSALLANAGPAPAQAVEPTDALLRRARAFDQLLPWIPFQGECLYRCALLLRRLKLAGERPLWVFGVRTWPFLAHCWLQVGDVALTDPAETLSVFSPILAV